MHAKMASFCALAIFFSYTPDFWTQENLLKYDRLEMPIMIGRLWLLMKTYFFIIGAVL